MRCELVMEERTMPPANNYVIERYMTTTATATVMAMTMKKPAKMGICFIFIGACVCVCARAVLAGGREGGVRFPLKQPLMNGGSPFAIARNETKLLKARRSLSAKAQKVNIWVII